MIVEFFIQLGTAMVTWVLGLLPSTDSAEDLIISAENAFAPIMAGAGALGAWLPWGTLGLVFPVVIAFYIAAFGVKVFRQLFTHVPLFGGTG